MVDYVEDITHCDEEQEKIRVHVRVTRLHQSLASDSAFSPGVPCGADSQSDVLIHLQSSQ